MTSSSQRHNPESTDCIFGAGTPPAGAGGWIPGTQGNGRGRNNVTPSGHRGRVTNSSWAAIDVHRHVRPPCWQAYIGFWGRTCPITQPGDL